MYRVIQFTRGNYEEVKEFCGFGFFDLGDYKLFRLNFYPKGSNQMEGVYVKLGNYIFKDKEKNRILGVLDSRAFENNYSTFKIDGILYCEKYKDSSEQRSEDKYFISLNKRISKLENLYDEFNVHQKIQGDKDKYIAKLEERITELEKTVTEQRQIIKDHMYNHVPEPEKTIYKYPGYYRRDELKNPEEKEEHITGLWMFNKRFAPDVGP